MNAPHNIPRKWVVGEPDDSAATCSKAVVKLMTGNLTNNPAVTAIGRVSTCGAGSVAQRIILFSLTMNVKF